MGSCNARVFRTKETKVKQKYKVTIEASYECEVEADSFEDAENQAVFKHLSGETSELEFCASEIREISADVQREHKAN